MPRLLPWRVRVRLSVEHWVDVEAETAGLAEAAAANLPNVLSVFGKSAVRADKLAEAQRSEGVQEGLD